MSVHLSSRIINLVIMRMGPECWPTRGLWCTSCQSFSACTYACTQLFRKNIHTYICVYTYIHTYMQTYVYTARKQRRFDVQEFRHTLFWGGFGVWDRNVSASVCLSFCLSVCLSIFLHSFPCNITWAYLGFMSNLLCVCVCVCVWALTCIYFRQSISYIHTPQPSNFMNTYIHA
jgi:hypothetical protein